MYLSHVLCSAAPLVGMNPPAALTNGRSAKTNTAALNSIEDVAIGRDIEARTPRCALLGNRSRVLSKSSESQLYLAVLLQRTRLNFAWGTISFLDVT